MFRQSQLSVVLYDQFKVILYLYHRIVLSFSFNLYVQLYRECFAKLTPFKEQVFGILLLLSSNLLKCLELYLLRKMNNVRRHCNLSNLDFTLNEEHALLEL